MPEPISPFESMADSVLAALEAPDPLAARSAAAMRAVMAPTAPELTTAT
jgi:hypothetical protein